MKPKTRIIINDLEVEYEIIHRKVKYPRLEIKTDLLYIILPEDNDNARELIKKHENWIYKKFIRIKKLQIESEKRKLNLNRDDDEFKTIIHHMVRNNSSELNLKVNQIRFRRMKTRWGSCSSKGNLNFNIYLKYLPDHLIEYIVFHEISHLIEMGHNKKFWNIIKKRFPEYKETEEELEIYWLKVKEYAGI